jgi:predicted MPP superfamily phosphohydrolase
VVDVVMLAALPWLGLSYGPITPAVLLLILTQGTILGVYWQIRKRARKGWVKTVAILTTTFFLAGLFLLTYDMFYVEPFRLTVTRLEVKAPAFLPDRDLRILQITDLHVERLTVREQNVLEQAQKLKPDIIVLTGDYFNSSYLEDPITFRETKTWLAQLQAPYGVYAVNGNVDSPFTMRDLFQGLDNIHVLDNEDFPIKLPGGTIYLIGMTYKVGPAFDNQVLPDLMTELPPDAYSLLLYHTSDLIRTADRLGINLYLSGHTHGGQIRLPFYGAIYTSAYYGKQYEMGEYQVGPTTLYVSRGIGMAGDLIPRVRFLCPPELVLVDLGK